MYRKSGHSDELDYQIRQQRGLRLGHAVKVLLMTYAVLCGIGVSLAILLYILYMVGVFHFSFV